MSPPPFYYLRVKSVYRMNIVYLRYATVIAKAGSLSKAAEELFVAQPNLSRAIKELEKELDITIFERTSKGIVLTPDGERLIENGKKILRQIDELEKEFTDHLYEKTRFALSAPRASYISRAFAAFSRSLSDIDRAEAYYKETNARHTISDVYERGYNLGIVRYPSQYDRQFKESFAQKGLACELIAEFEHILITRRGNTLSTLKEVTAEDLTGYTEVAYADPFAPSVSEEELKREELSVESERRIFVYGRAERFEILAANDKTYMLVAPLPQDILDSYGLVALPCKGGTKKYRDVLIYDKTRKLTKVDKVFMTALCDSKRECFK